MRTKSVGIVDLCRYLAVIPRLLPVTFVHKDSIIAGFYYLPLHTFQESGSTPREGKWEGESGKKNEGGAPSPPTQSAVTPRR